MTTEPGVTAFAELLLRHRRRAGLGQRELAARSGLSERALRDLERGVRTPRRQSIRAVAAALGLTGDELATFLAAARPAPTEFGPTPYGPSAPATAPRGDLVGRGEELRLLADLVAGGRHRIITVTGPAGVGKSRVAAELAAVLSGRTTLEVVTLDLSAVTEPDLVGELVAEALGCGPSRLRPVDRIAAHLGPRRVIVVLDRLERLLAAATDLAELSRRCAGLTLLATSQRPLHVRRERVVPLGPLPADAATTLFVRRAAAVRPGFAPTSATGAVIAAICRRLDHLPLAIELAAARIRMLEPAELLERLDRRLPVLADGARDLPARHRSLRAAIESSLEVVGPDAVTLFGWLGAFAGGGRLDDLEAVAEALGRDRIWLLGALEELVDTNLVRVAPADGASRYELPDTMAELAAERIGAAADGPAVRDAVAGRFLELVRAAAAGTGHAIIDSANVRAAIAWAVDRDPTSLDPPTIEAFHRYYETTSRLVEGQTTLARLAAAGHAVAWVRAGQLAVLRGELTEASRLGERALAELDPVDLAARVSARMLLAHAAVENGDGIGSRAHLRMALVDARRSGDLRLFGRVLNNLGGASAERGRLRDAERQLSAALEAKRRGGAGPMELGRSQFNLAEIELEAGHYDRAAAGAAEAVRLLSAGGYPLLAAIAITTRALALLHSAGAGPALAAAEAIGPLLDSIAGDDPRATAVVELRRSVILHAAGRRAEAARVLRAALPAALDHTARDREQVAGVLEMHAWLMVTRDPATAAALLGVGGRLRRRPVPETTAALIDQVGRAGRAALGDRAFERQYREGAGPHRVGLVALCDRIA
jgi:predicted ATPase/transcriptional regulator with XRE-family HTH domain